MAYILVSQQMVKLLKLKNSYMIINKRNQKSKISISFFSSLHYKTSKKKQILTYVIIPTICLEIDKTLKDSFLIDNVEYGKFVHYELSFDWLCWGIKIKFLKINK